METYSHLHTLGYLWLFLASICLWSIFIYFRSRFDDLNCEDFGIFCNSFRYNFFVYSKLSLNEARIVMQTETYSNLHTHGYLWLLPALMPVCLWSIFIYFCSWFDDLNCEDFGIFCNSLRYNFFVYSNLRLIETRIVTQIETYSHLLTLGYLW